MDKGPTQLPGTEALQSLDLGEDPFGLGDEQIGVMENLGKRLFGPGKKKPKVRKEEQPPTTPPANTPGPKEEGQGIEDPRYSLNQSDKLLEDVKKRPYGVMNVGRGKSNINLQLFSKNSRQVLDLVNKYQGRLTEVRTPQTHEETIKLSQQAETIERVFKKQASDAWRPEEVVAIGQIMEGSAIELHTKALGINEQISAGATVSDQELLEFASLHAEVISIQHLYSGAAVFAGRLLNSFKAIPKASPGMDQMRAIKRGIEEQGGREAIEQIVKSIAAVPKGQRGFIDFGGVLTAVKGDLWDKTWKGVLTYRYSSMLSSIRTHGANIIGSTFATVNENLIIRPLAVTVNKGNQGIRAILGINPLDADQAMLWREAWAADRAFIDGAVTSWTGIKDIASGRKMAEDGKFMNEIGTRYNHKEVPENMLGKMTTFPVRLLEMEDAFFRATNYQMELARLARRRAVNSTKSPDEAKTVYDEIMASPPDEFIMASQEFAKRAIFANNPNSYGKVLGAVAHMFSAAKAKSNLFHLLFPFVNTPTNLLGYARNHTIPFSSGELLKSLAKGTPVERADASARFIEAAGLYAIAYNMWQAGELTGAGHPNKSMRKIYNQAGIMSNSLKIGNHYVQLNRLDPVGLALGMFATGLDYSHVAERNGDGASGPDIALNTVIAVAELMQDRSMLSTTSDLFSVINGIASTSTKGDVLGSLLAIPAIMQPGIVRDVRIMSDPMQRQMSPDEDIAKGSWDRVSKRFMNAWPGLSERLPVNRDWTGSPIMEGGNFLIRGLLPVKMRGPTTDKNTIALIKFNVPVAEPQPTVRLDTVPLDLRLMRVDPEGFVYNKYREFVGKARQEEIDFIVDARLISDMKPDKEGLTAFDRDEYYYEDVQLELRQGLAIGKRYGTADFLEWLDSADAIYVDGPRIEKEQFPGSREIILREIFNDMNYPGIYDELRSNPDKAQPDIYRLRKRSTIPAADKLDF